MEVRQQRVDAAELEAGRDEERRAARERAAAGERLEYAHRRRADGEHALGGRGCAATRRARPSSARRAARAPRASRRRAAGTCRGRRAASRARRRAAEQLGREVEAGGRRGRGARLVRVDGLVARRVGERLGDVGRQRRRSRGSPSSRRRQRPSPSGSSSSTGPSRSPAAASARAAPAPPRCRRRRAARAAAPPPRRRSRRRRSSRAGTTRVSLTTTSSPPSSSRQLREDAVPDCAGRPLVDEQPRRVAPLRGVLRDQLLRQLVVELVRVHPTRSVASCPWTNRHSSGPRRGSRTPPPAGRPRPSWRPRSSARATQIEALAAGGRRARGTLPEQIGSAVRDGLRAEVLPVARQIAEIRGLLNQAIRRLERLEGDLLAERHARIDDLALARRPRLVRLEGRRRAARAARARQGGGCRPPAPRRRSSEL